MMAARTEPEPTSLMAVLRDVEATRGIPVETLCGALEEALPAAYAQHAGEGVVLAYVDRETAEIVLHRRWTVVESVTDPTFEIGRIDVPQRYEPGDYFFAPVDLAKFGRLAALTAKRVIAQHIVAHEREEVYQHYRPLQGTIVRGLVQREIHGSVYVVFEDGNEAVLPRSERAPRDHFEINDEMEAELHVVGRTSRGPALILSRNRASFVRALFGDGVLAAARRPGFVTYLAVAIGCDATHAVEVARAIGERIEIVRWSSNPAELAKAVFPTGTEAFTVEPYRVVFVEAAEATPLRLSLAMELTGWPVVVAEPGKADEALDAHLAALEAAEPPPGEFAIDPKMIATLEAFAAERAAADDRE